MGTLVGHVAPGLAFFVYGLWQLFNHIRLHSLNPNTYTSSPWFPTSRLRYLELYFIMIGTSISIAMELVIGPARHNPFDTDWTIPSNHLHNFEHASISMTFFVYAVSAIVLDKISPKSARQGLTQLIASIAFAQQFLLFHLHSADHMGVEGQYHWLLQLVIFVSLSTTLIGIAVPESFLVSFVRSLSILFQGVWLIVMGYMLWTPSLIPKGCFISSEEGHQVVRCRSEEAVHRAKSLVNIEFSWFLVLITVFGVWFYLVLVRIYGEKVEYSTIRKEEEEEEEEDVESQKVGNFLAAGFDSEQKSSKLDVARSFVQMGKSFGPIDMER